jgi:predicted TIM-barrel fold metal-dependent hydrolase
MGPERILFGTDTPLYFSPMQRARVDNAEISDGAKRMILRENAERVFRAKLGPASG